MRKFLIGIVFLFITLLFFYPIFKGFIPFPGDLLVGNHEPYKSFSYKGYAPGGVPHKAQGADVIRELFPWKFFSIEQLKTGKIPFWNPYSFSGNPHLANLQSGTFYGINVFFFLMPFAQAWTIYILLQPLLAGVFTYLFLRDLKIGGIAAVYGGVSFSFSASMVVWMQYGVFGHAILWLPLVLFLINRFISKPSGIKILYLIAVLSQSILAGYIQLVIYLYIFSLSFIFFRFLNDKNRRSRLMVYMILVFPFIVALLLTAFQTFPLIEFVGKSLRKPYGFDQLSERLIPLKNIITIIFPDFFGNPATRNYWLSGTYIERASYIGILSVVFILFAAFKAKVLYKNFFIFTFVITYLSALDLYPVKFFHSLGLPFLSTGVPSRILSIFCFASSVLAAEGLDSYLKDDNKRKYIKPFIAVLIIVISSWILVLVGKNDNFLITKRNLILPTVIFCLGAIILFVLRLSSKKTAALLLFLTIIDLFYFFHKITPFSPKEYLYPKTEVIEELKKVQGINRYWGYGSGHIESNFQLYEKNFSPEGYDALYIKRYGELISSSKNGKVPSEVPATVADIAPGYGEDELKSNYFRQRILNLLGVKYVFHKINNNRESFSPDYRTFEESIYRLIWQKGNWQIYENKESLPRVFLASKYVVISNKEDILRKLFDKKFDIRNTIIVEEEIPIKPEHDVNARVVVEGYSPNKIVLSTSSISNKLLFLSDNFYSGWKVNIDGKSSTIYRANYSFRAVPLSSGTHRVEMWYYPDSFVLGVKISLITLIGITGYLLVSLIKKKQHV